MKRRAAQPWRGHRRGLLATARAGREQRGARGVSSTRQTGGVLRLCVRGTQVERSWRAVSFGRRGAQSRDPGDVRSAALIDLERPLDPLWPGRREQAGSGADDADRPGDRRAHRITQGGDAGRNQRAPAGAENLDVDMVVPRIDCSNNVAVVVLGNERSGKACKRRKPDGRLPRGERDAAAGRYSDPQPGKAAGAGGDRNSVEIGELELGTVHDAGYE